jgi:WhiB family redox-sensing transcriptional regulator
MGHFRRHVEAVRARAQGAGRLLTPPNHQNTRAAHKAARSLFGVGIREERRDAVEMETQVKWTEARCATGDASLLHLFFSEEEHEIAVAKSVCEDCPLLLPCFEGAVERREPWGVWGGTLFDRGVPIERKPKRGRPPKERPAGIEAVDEDEAEVA